MALFRKTAETVDTDSLQQRIEELEAVLAQLEQMADIAQVAWWEADLVNGRVTWSDSLRKLLNHPADATLTINDYSDRLNTIAREDFEAKLQKTVMTGEGFQMEHSLQTHGIPAEVFVRVRGSLQKDETGKPLRLVGMLQNVSNEREKDMELRKMALVAARTDSGVLILDREQRTEWVNPSLTRILSYTLEELKGKQPFSLFASDKTSPQVLERIQTGIAEVDSFSVDGLFQDKFGSPLWMELTLSPVMSHNDELLNYVVLISDENDRKAKEEAILELNKELRTKNEDVLDSIRYARRIQYAILPSLEEFSWACPNSFVFYKPKDIVSGDFYWYRTVGPYLYVAAVDCTGHGVPGAFMSVLGNSILNELLGDGSAPEPHEVLHEWDKRVEATLHREQSTEKVNDGMDVALIRMNLIEKQIDFAGANRPFSVVRKGEVHEIKGDPYSIGFQVLLTDQSDKAFHSHPWAIEPGDQMYLFSDGITDQFGGEREKKWSKKSFYNLLESLGNADADTVKQALEANITQWRGDKAQTDDILVIGITADA